MSLQALGGLLLAALVLWQLSTGLKWVKLGRARVRIHRVSGIVLAVIVVPHLLLGLYLAYGWFAAVFGGLSGL